jgi:hypothetical protein
MSILSLKKNIINILKGYVEIVMLFVKMIKVLVIFANFIQDIQKHI